MPFGQGDCEPNMSVKVLSSTQGFTKLPCSLVTVWLFFQPHHSGSPKPARYIWTMSVGPLYGPLSECHLADWWARILKLKAFDDLGESWLAYETPSSLHRKLLMKSLPQKNKIQLHPAPSGLPKMDERISTFLLFLQLQEEHQACRPSWVLHGFLDKVLNLGHYLLGSCQSL